MKKLIYKWEKLQRRYYNLFAVSTLVKYYQEIFEEPTEWNKEFIINALIADELTHRKEDDRESLEYEIELVTNNLKKDR
tara:strand:- start:1152 stop:1388 length:237 start_codon:yes stop_codon:yes gene_type:complete